VFDSCDIITGEYIYGSFVVIEPDLLLTAGHCINMNTTSIKVNDIEYDILKEWVDTIYDIGFVKINGTLPFLKFGNMPKLLDEVYLVGSPYEPDLVDTVTKGIISHLDRNIYGRIGLIQTDAEGAPGSSGGPLFNTKGEIIGICVSGVTPGGGVVFCEPVSHILKALERYNAL